MNKIFNKFLIGVLFLLGIILIPAFKADATIPVTVYADGQTSSKTINYGNYTRITWTSTGATSCTRSDTGATVATTDLTGFLAGLLYTTTTFIINCTSHSLIGFSISAYYGYNSTYGTCGQPTTVFTDSSVSGVVPDILLWRDRNLTNPYNDQYITNEGGDTYQMINGRVGQIVYISC